jgi:hypothetical protein
MSLLVTQLSGFGVGGSGVTEAVYTTSGFDETDLSTYSFASVGLGTVGRPRDIVAAIWYHSIGAHRTVSSITADGVSGTLLASALRSGGGAELDLALYSFPGTGMAATGTLSFTLNAGAARAGYAVWAVYNLINTTAVATSSATGASPHTLDLNAVNGGVVIGVSNSFSSPDFSWTGLNEDFETADGDEISGASNANVAAATPRAVSVTISAGSPLSIAVSLR